MLWVSVVQTWSCTLHMIKLKSFAVSFVNSGCIARMGVIERDCGGLGEPGKFQVSFENTHPLFPKDGMTLIFGIA